MFAFATSDPARYQLLFQRTIPGFEPSPESYAPAVEMYTHSEELMTRLGITDPDAMDIWTALDQRPHLAAALQRSRRHPLGTPHRPHGRHVPRAGRTGRADTQEKASQVMETRTDEIADDIFRLSTFIPDPGIMFNQFVVRAEQPLLFHTGMRSLFPLVSEAVSKIVPLDELRWITFGHVEADECGAMNQFLAVAPNATVAHGALACMVQVNDLADRAPHPLAADEVLDLGGKRVRNIDTPHLPHGWDAHVIYEETTGTLFCGDLFTRYGECGAHHDRRHRRDRARSGADGPTHRAHAHDRADDPAARASSTSTRWR